MLSIKHFKFKMTDFADCPIDLHYLAENQPSLCIPRLFPNIDEAFILKTIENVGLGKVSRIDLLERRSPKGELYKRAFIHFEKWHWNPAAQDARKRLITGKDIKIVYNNPWFWKISANRWTPQKSDRHDNKAASQPLPVAPTLNPHSTPFAPKIAPTLPITEMPFPMLSPTLPVKDQRNMYPPQVKCRKNGRKPRINLQEKDSATKPQFAKREDISTEREKSPHAKSLKINLSDIEIVAENDIVGPTTPPAPRPATPPGAPQDEGLTIDYGNVPYPPAPKLRRQKAQPAP